MIKRYADIALLHISYSINNIDARNSVNKHSFNNY